MMGVETSMAQRRAKADRGWTVEPNYDKPDISVRATTAYYEIIAPVMLPYVSLRLLNLFRCRAGKCFFQRSRAHPPSSHDFKEPVKFEPVKQKNGRTEDYLYVTDVEGIIACSKVQTVEFHGWGSRADSIDRPDRLVIDLDPGEDVTFRDVKAAALQLRQSLEAIGLESFPLLTGGKGLHLVVPLTPEAEWPQVREFAKMFCTALAEADSGRFTVALPKTRRKGRIFLDYLRNQRTATAILPYSARARHGTPVAVPVTWEEIPKFTHANAFSIADVDDLLKRANLKRLNDWGLVDQRLPHLR